eukprot:TRINITY_DN61390_c0_g1_i3.p1 TRINITY_DN61390_c0_g1~~TRINITY_DN61390_c0_g1_i3.p1  ORF type:complete len:307 (-),score=8.93 TRINITY_DN61390_c0_g1_i3:142-930(-)
MRRNHTSAQETNNTISGGWRNAVQFLVCLVFVILLLHDSLGNQFWMKRQNKLRQWYSGYIIYSHQEYGMYSQAFSASNVCLQGILTNGTEIELGEWSSSSPDFAAWNTTIFRPKLYFSWMPEGPSSVYHKMPETLLQYYCKRWVQDHPSMAPVAYIRQWQRRNSHEGVSYTYLRQRPTVKCDNVNTTLPPPPEPPRPKPRQSARASVRARPTPEMRRGPGSTPDMRNRLLLHAAADLSAQRRLHGGGQPKQVSRGRRPGLPH